MKIELIEMALSRTDAIDRCIGKGKIFIEHFNKIYNNPKVDTVHHWCSEMQSWYNDIMNIVIKSNNKHLNNSQKKDWFYSFGSSYEEYFNYDEDKIEKYEEFIDYLDTSNDVYNSILKIFSLT